ncbi:MULTISPECIES: ABC transporter substrate-binding protein [Paenibacillus]|uniref:ABC transporter substrate-binding protein n=1 Tax=Paenibacillus borealis TaxID=160799 RepID=A0ABX3H0F4_PAEBO|nr:ABC transporter substrate-binding protein [Paenibacillus borealis]OMD42382.1 ABC transporter substrate-binding protein [Paenibacillus borealis]
MKSKSIKTAFTLMLMSSMLIAGCGGGNNNKNVINTPADNGAKNTGNNAADDTAMDTSPFTISFFGGDASPNWNKMQDDVGKVITEKTGVTINAEFDVGSGGGDQKIPMMAASEDVPDLIFAKGNLSILVDAGLVIDLTDLIDKYAPNLKKVYGDNMNRLKYSLDDQSIYQIPTNMGVGQQSFDATGGFEIQHRVLKELGYPEVKTLADYEKVLKDYVALHPETDGQPTIPLTLNADDWKIMITVTNPAFTTTGAPDDGEYYVDPETYEAKLHYKRPEEKEYFRWLNGMYAQGLLDKDAFVQKDDQYKAKVASGRVLGLISQEWEYSDGENALKAAGKDEYTYAHFPVTLSEEYKDHSFMSTGIDGYGLAITTAAKDPVRIIKWLDWMSSDEGQVLRSWGVEGKHYTVNADGKREVPAEISNRKANDAANFAKETGIGQYLIFGARYGDGVKDSTDNYYTATFPEEIVAAYSEAEKESLKGYNATTWKDLFPKEDEFPVKDTGALYNMPVPTDGQYQVIFNKTRDIVRKRIPEAILSKPADFDKVYDAFLVELDKAGAQDMEKEFTELVKKRVSLWTGKDL